MTPLDFAFLRRLLKGRSGLDLSADKGNLVEERLLPLARCEGFDGIDDLIRALRADDHRLIGCVVEAMTTNETFFFRDKTPFDDLREIIIPALLQSRASRRSLRIWSSACSTGQEPYSIAMCLNEFGAQLAGWHVEILATDISEAVLARSQLGIFSHFEVQRGLPIHLLLKYFTQVGETLTGKAWQANPELRAMVTHRPFNLLHDVTPLGTFDVIFCRNVMIHFDADTKTSLFARLAGALETDGALALGGAETAVGLTDAFKPHPDGRGLYRRELRSPSLATRLSPFKVVAR